MAAKKYNFQDEVFDNFYSNVNMLECRIIKLLTDNKIDLHGYLKNDQDIETKDLWEYVYYLRQHNQDDIAFKDMQKNERASADSFISVVIGDVVPDKTEIKKVIIAFIKRLDIRKLNIPVLEELYENVIKQVEIEVKGKTDQDIMLPQDNPLNLCASLTDDYKINIKPC